MLHCSDEFQIFSRQQKIQKVLGLYLINHHIKPLICGQHTCLVYPTALPESGGCPLQHPVARTPMPDDLFWPI